MSLDYPVDRFARLKLEGRQFAWRTGKVIPHKAPLEIVDPLEAYAPFLFDSLAAAQKSHADDMVKLWNMVADGRMSSDDAYAVDEIMGIFRCTIEADGRIHATDPGHHLPTIAERRAFEDRRFGPTGEFEITREDAFAAHGITDPLASLARSM
ncbi:hypothetical protein ACVIGB_000133 [Bradyrhizobium sp. USDA 4341]